MSDQKNSQKKAVARTKRVDRKPRKHMTALEAAKVETPIRPLPQEIKMISQEFRLTAPQEKAFESLIDDFFELATVQRTSLAGVPPPSTSAAQARRIAANLLKLKKTLDELGDDIRFCIPAPVSEILIKTVTFEAMKQGVILGRQNAEDGGYDRFNDDYSRQPSRKYLNLGLRHEAEILALKYPGEILKHLVTQFSGVFADWVKQDKKRPGAPKRHFRNLLIRMLVKASKDILGEPAVGTSDARFEQFCAAVLAAVKISDKGLKRAIETQLREARDAFRSPRQLDPK